MDKCSNNFVSNCKKHYGASVFNDINSLGGTGVKSSLSESANKFEQSVAIVCLSVRLGLSGPQKPNLELYHFFYIEFMFKTI